MAAVRRARVSWQGNLSTGLGKLEALSSEAAGLPERISSTVLRAVGVTPWKVELVPQGTLPRTSSGKPQRRKTRELFERGELPKLRAGVASCTDES